MINRLRSEVYPFPAGQTHKGLARMLRQQIFNCGVLLPSYNVISRYKDFPPIYRNFLLQRITKSFKIQQYSNSVIPLHSCDDSRIIDPAIVSSDWTGDKSPLFRPLSRLVGVSYNTVVRYHWLYFTRNWLYNARMRLVPLFLPAIALLHALELYVHYNYSTLKYSVLRGVY